MGHQINFFLGPEDLRELERRLRGAGELVMLHSRSPEPKPNVVDNIDYAEDGKRWTLFLARPADLTDVVLKHVPQQGYWVVDVLFSPVVELDRGHYDGKVLKRGRLYYVDGFYKGDQWVEKSAEFITWAKQLFTAARKSLKRDKESIAYLGPEAQELRSQGVELKSI
jgi:hypothetical protein